MRTSLQQHRPGSAGNMARRSQEDHRETPPFVFHSFHSDRKSSSKQACCSGRLTKWVKNPFLLLTTLRLQGGQREASRKSLDFLFCRIIQPKNPWMVLKVNPGSFWLVSTETRLTSWAPPSTCIHSQKNDFYQGVRLHLNGLAVGGWTALWISGRWRHGWPH